MAPDDDIAIKDVYNDGVKYAKIKLIRYVQWTMKSKAKRVGLNW